MEARKNQKAKNKSNKQKAKSKKQNEKSKTQTIWIGPFLTCYVTIGIGQLPRETLEKSRHEAKEPRRYEKSLALSHFDTISTS